MNTWFPLWSFTVESSLWDEPDWVIKIFMTMCAVKDADHVCRFSAYQIARKSRKTETEVMKAIKILSSPDSKRKENQEYGGRRIEKTAEGWLILNGEKYRAMVQLEMKRARNRRSQAAYRQRQKQGGGPQALERQYDKTFGDEGPNAADQLLKEQPVPYRANGKTPTS